MNENKKIYTPFHKRDGSKVVAKYEERFVDEVGNEAIITKCDILTKKQKMIFNYTLYVKWL